MDLGILPLIAILTFVLMFIFQNKIANAIFLLLIGVHLFFGWIYDKISSMNLKDKD